jgi:hypothetical protein
MPLRVGAIYLLIIATIAALVPVWAKSAQAANETRPPDKIPGAFDLQGHRGARGLAPENTLPAFATALSIGVTTLELDLAMTSDGILVVSHDSRLNPDHTRGPDGTFLDAEGPAIRSLTLAQVQRYDVGRLKAGTAYAAAFPEQRGMDGVRIPTLTAVFDLVRQVKTDHVRFNIETKLTPTLGRRHAGPGDVCCRRAASGARGGACRAGQHPILRLAHACGFAPHRATDRARLPDC